MQQVSVPTAPGVLEYGGFAAFVLVALATALHVRRHRTVTPMVLVLIGAWSVWWQEWWLDWAYYLIWSPRFDFLLHDDWTGWTTPIKPWLVVMSGYGYYWAAVFVAVAWAVDAVQRRKPRWSRVRTFAVAAFPVAYVINLLFEGTCTQLGWWSYTEAPAPALDFGKGSFSLLSPIVFMALFPVTLAWILQRRDEFGRFAHEARIGIRPGSRGALVEVRRVAIMVALTNVVYFVTGILPGIVLRYAVGPDSTLVP